MNNLLVGVLCNKIKPDLFSTVQGSLPFNLLLFTNRGINWEQRSISGLLLHNGQWRQREVRFPDAVYNQRYTQSSATAFRLEREIGRGRVFNMRTRFNKLITYSILEKSIVKPLLIPTRAYSDNSLLEMLDASPVIMKPVYGAKGRDVLKIVRHGDEYKVYSQSDYESITISRPNELLNWARGYTDREGFVLQPFISFDTLGGYVIDLRMLVQKDSLGEWRVTATLSRIGFQRYYVSNLAWNVRPGEQVLESVPSTNSFTQLRNIAIAVAAKMEMALGHLGELSVDYGIAAGRPWIIEVNGMPQKQIFRDISVETLERVVRTPLLYAKFLASSS
jgi:glutathione synthase/RimK-type ligase-like ATP-grasp enzyme